MAQRNVSVLPVGPDTFEFTWLGLLNGDNGEPIAISDCNDKTVGFNGTPGAGGVIKLKGTNKPTITIANDQVLNTPVFPGGAVAAAISWTAVASPDFACVVLENTYLVYPHVTAGDGTTNLECRITAKRSPR
jgi:hypothetical protein